LLTGAAIGQLWTNVDDKRGGKKVPVIFTCLVAASVACELLVVFISTAISTKMMGSAFDPMATSPLALLMREFELPFIACRGTRPAIGLGTLASAAAAPSLLPPPLCCC
jgi:hypothetical protein